MAVVHAWQGALTHTSITIRAKITGSSARLLLSNTVELTNPTFTASTSPTAYGIVTFTLDGLPERSSFFWAIEDTGVLDSAWRGRFRTLPAPGAVANFTVAISACAGLSAGESVVNAVSNGIVFDSIRQADPAMVIHLGDMHYRNIAANNPALFRQAFDDVLTFNGLGATARQGRLYREIPLSYGWDDHDFGPNNSDSTSASNAAANQVFRERVPHYPLEGGSGVYQSWQIGRTLFILSDTRTFRDPQSVPAAERSMLGVQQKAWMRQILSNSTAKILIWCMPTPWLGTDDDSWGGYREERAELVRMMSDLGWAKRLVMVCGDRHALALDTGSGPGGWTNWLVGSLDSGGGGSDTQYNGGFSPGSRRWGKFTIFDNGSEIRVVGAGMIGDRIWQQYTTTFDVRDLSNLPLPAPTAASASSEITWLACNALSGRVVDELPDLTGSFSRVLGAYTTAQLDYPLTRAGAAARRLVVESTEIGSSMLVAVVNGKPAWAGLPILSERGSDPNLSLAVPSIEGYLQRRYVRDHTWTQVDEATIIRGLLADAGDWSLVGGRGLPLLFDLPPTGTLRDRTYAWADRKTVYEALTELMAVINGPEWTIRYEWGNDQQSSVALIATARKRIGNTTSTPNAVFESSGAAATFSSEGSSNATYTHRRDYSDGRGANVVIAYSSGEGETQPASNPHFDRVALTYMPILERHFQPSSSITEIPTLNEHARAELSRLSQGTNAIDLSVRWNQRPRWGIDWDLGDLVGWDLRGPGHPDGLTGSGRVIGWDLNPSTELMTLIMQEPQGVT